MENLNETNNFQNLGVFETGSLTNRTEGFYNYIQNRKSNNIFQYNVVSEHKTGASMQIVNPFNGKRQTVDSYISNDYLGFSYHPEVILAGIKAIYQYGASAGASQLIGGQLQIHEELETTLSNFFEKEATVLFPSGYAANIGLLTLFGKNDLIIMDMYVHASIKAGCCYASTKTFLHNDMESLEAILINSKAYDNRIIVVDGVYSQEGDIANLDRIVELAKKYNVIVAVDDAHGIGVFGKDGRGVLDSNCLYRKVDIVIGTLSKALGSAGGFVAGNKQLINYLKHFAGANIFSVGLSPQATGSALKSLELLQTEKARRENILSNIRYFKEGLDKRNINYGNSQSQIFPVLFKDEIETNNAAMLLFENNIFINPITYPAVPKKRSRLRVSILATHTKEQLDRLLHILHTIKNTDKESKDRNVN